MKIIARPVNFILISTHTKDKQTGYSLSICMKNNNDDDNNNNNNNKIVIIRKEGAQLPMPVFSGSLIKVTKVIN